MGFGSEKMNVKKVLHEIVKRIDNDLYRDENNRVMHKTDEFKDIYFNAHGDFMPDDYMYEHIEKIISEIELYLSYNTDDYDDIDDLIDELAGEITIEPDQYISALLTWMGSDLKRYAIVDELYQQDIKYDSLFWVSKHRSLFDLIQVAQSIEIEEVKTSILDNLRSMVDEEE